jgi:hypothetical protein
MEIIAINTPVTAIESSKITAILALSDCLIEESHHFSFL